MKKTLCLLALTLLALPPVLAADLYEGKVEGVRIAVWSLPDKDEIETLVPGNPLRLKPRQEVMLRLFSPRHRNPTGVRQYLAGAFQVEEGANYIELEEHNPDKGSVVVKAPPRAAGRKGALRYELLGDVEVEREYQAAWTIPVEVAELPEEEQQRLRERPPGRLGVTLYEHSNYGGRSETIYEDVPRLSDHPIGNDRATSIRVPEGCTVTLYRDSYYRGNTATLTTDSPELGRTPVGNDAVSSLKIRCE